MLRRVKVELLFMKMSMILSFNFGSLNLLRTFSFWYLREDHKKKNCFVYLLFPFTVAIILEKYQPD